MSLLRYAIQHLYSPVRLIHEDSAFSRTPMQTTRSVPLINQASVLALPLASWAAGNDTVTAVLLKNTTRHRVVLDPRRLQGDWLAVSFYPSNYLNARGHWRDRTTVFVVASQPFNQALHAARDYR